MSGLALAADRSFVNSATDVIGIVAAVGALALLFRVDSMRSKGQKPAKRLKGAALVATLLALVVIGGRFSWLPSSSNAVSAASQSVVTPTSEDSESAAGEAVTTVAPGPSGDEVAIGADVGQTIETTPPATATTSSTTSPPTTRAGPAVPPTATATPTVPSEGVAPATESGSEGPNVPAAEPSTPVATGLRVVVEGESFWSIADDVVSDSLGRSATAAEVAPYWQVLVEQNVDNLPQPGNPDLIVPGLSLNLPAVGALGP